MVKVSRIQKEPLSGKGEIKKAADHFADCTYQIQVEQEVTISESINERQVVPGIFIYTGTVTISLPELLKPGILEGMNSGEIFTLLLSDGRALKTAFNPIQDVNNPINGKYRIIPAP